VGLFSHLPLWLTLLVKFLVVMCIPLQFQITNILDLVLLPFYGMLFTPATSDYYYGYVTRGYIQPFGLSTIVTNIGLGLLLAFPYIIFNYRLVKSPLNRPFRNLAVGTLVISSFIIFMAMLIVMPLFSSTYYYNYQLIQNVQAFPTIAIAAFILLPMIQRQAVSIATPEEMHSLTMREIEPNPELSVRREKILAMILWIGLCFLPFFLVTSYSYYYGSTSIISFAYSFYLGYSGPLLYESGFPIIQGIAIPFFSLIVSGILGGLQFVYVRDIYRFLRHEIKFRRLMNMGILAALFPAIGYYALSALISPWSLASMSALPIPCMFFLGVLITRLHRSVLPYANRVWKDVDARMWFEPKEESHRVITQPEKPYRPSEETIKVPLTYMVVSQIRKKRHNGHSQRDEEDEQPW
jgi:hypothetical protein